MIWVFKLSVYFFTWFVQVDKYSAHHFSLLFYLNDDGLVHHPIRGRERSLALGPWLGGWCIICTIACHVRHDMIGVDIRVVFSTINITLTVPLYQHPQVQVGHNNSIFIWKLYSWLLVFPLITHQSSNHTTVSLQRRLTQSQLIWIFLHLVSSLGIEMQPPHPHHKPYELRIYTCFLRNIWAIDCSHHQKIMHNFFKM